MRCGAGWPVADRQSVETATFTRYTKRPLFPEARWYELPDGEEMGPDFETAEWLRLPPGGVEELVERIARAMYEVNAPASAWDEAADLSRAICRAKARNAIGLLPDEEEKP